jgi:hypothetical protein
MAGGLEVMMNLGAVLVIERCDGLDFQYDSVEAQNIRNIRLLEDAPFCTLMEAPGASELRSLESHFDFQALLIHRFQESAFLVRIDFNAFAHGAEAFFFVNDRRQLPSRMFGVSRG